MARRGRPPANGGGEEKTPEQLAAELAARKAEKGKKFRTLAYKRLLKVTAAIEGLRALSNTGSYAYTEAEVTKIFKTIADTSNRVFDAYGFTQTVAAKTGADDFFADLDDNGEDEPEDDNDGEEQGAENTEQTDA
jgi:hypothetical protein